MIAQGKCSFCSQTFDFEDSSNSLLATCPHCGKENSVATHSPSHHQLHILRNTPTLAGGKPCPHCQSMLEPDVSLCVHCGYDFTTGKRKRTLWVLSTSGKRILFGAAFLMLCAAGASFMLLSAKPVDTGEDFETKKARAELTFRERLDEIAPLYEPKDQLELRRDTGQIVRGTLVKYAGTGTNRMVIIDMEEGGKELVPVNSQSREDRIRMDLEYREKYIQHMLNMPTTEPSEN